MMLTIKEFRKLWLSFFGIIMIGAPSLADDFLDTLHAIETRLDARLGVFVHDLKSDMVWSYHADDRFPMTSTFKTLACAALLARVDAGREQLDRAVKFEQQDLVTYSPVTEGYAGTDGMSLHDLCEAALHWSDNSAVNFVLKALGGPGAVTAFLRNIGDNITRLDRIEPDLNSATPGDLRDTTTPAAIAETLRSLVLGDHLKPASRALPQKWLLGNKVADALLRAGVPKDWQVADRSGAGDYGTRTITALLWPPEHAPISVSIFITETNASFDERNRAIAEIGTAIVAATMRH